MESKHESSYICASQVQVRDPPLDKQISYNLTNSLADICAHGQQVFVLHQSFKTFGKLVAINGKAYAAVLFEGRCLPLAFPANNVVSTWVRRPCG